MGKGKFLYEMAQNSPDINYIGIEKYESVLVRAVEKINLNPLENLRVMCVDAKSLGEIFDHEISCIYLNFSDPWPKNRHANRRLTSKIFLDIYENLFKDKKTIIQKTDNITLFASSIKNLNNYGYYFEEVSMDLENTNIPNIETEYENKFKNKGFKINYVKAIKK
jgi:tRNA (guanine-N7-)-methyltransferase